MNAISVPGAAIAGPGPLIGPTLAAQFGYLPGTLWILFGVVLGGAVQDFCILCGSLRRNARSLGQMAKDEIGPIGGFAALVGVFSIMVILIAVLALVVVNALRHSPWGTFTVGATIPIAMLMGAYMKWLRPHDVLGATILGLILLALALVGGRWIGAQPAQAQGKTAARVLPPSSNPYGLSYGQWSVKWWQWAIGTKYSKSPLNTTLSTPAPCGPDQSGPVFFLGGALGGPGEGVHRDCAVPLGKALLIPIVNVEWEEEAMAPPASIVQATPRRAASGNCSAETSATDATAAVNEPPTAIAIASA